VHSAAIVLEPRCEWGADCHAWDAYFRKCRTYVMEGVNVVGLRPSCNSYGGSGDTSFTFEEQLQRHAILINRVKGSVVDGGSILRDMHHKYESVDRIVQGHPVVPNRPKSFSEGRGQLHFQPVSDMLLLAGSSSSESRPVQRGTQIGLMTAAHNNDVEFSPMREMMEENLEGKDDICPRVQSTVAA
jgi:hypothetical protein